MKLTENEITVLKELSRQHRTLFNYGRGYFEILPLGNRVDLNGMEYDHLRQSGLIRPVGEVDYELEITEAGRKALEAGGEGGE